MKREYTPVPDGEILRRFWGGCSISDVADHVVYQEGAKKKEATARVERVLYESMRRERA